MDFSLTADQQSIRDAVLEHCSRFSDDYWLELLRSLDIPAAPVRTLDELFHNPQLTASGFFETIDSPNGPVCFPGTPAWFSKTPGRVAGPAPRLGAHTAEVMNELGLQGNSQ